MLETYISLLFQSIPLLFFTNICQSIGCFSVSDTTQWSPVFIMFSRDTYTNWYRSLPKKLEFNFILWRINLSGVGRRWRCNFQRLQFVSLWKYLKFNLDDISGVPGALLIVHGNENLWKFGPFVVLFDYRDFPALFCTHAVQMQPRTADKISMPIVFR